MEALGGLQERVRAAERQVEANAKVINQLSGKSANQATEIAVLVLGQREVHEDILELKAQLKWILRALGGLIVTLLMVGGSVLASIVAHG